MKTKLALFVFILFVAISSCKKDEDPIPPVVTPTQTFQLTNTIGSYWVYSITQIDSTGAETPSSLLDSVYVIGDTSINGSTYVHYHGTYFGSPQDWMIRDSSNFIVNHYGDVLYNRAGFTDTVQTADNGTYITYSMTAPGLTPITVPAVTADCYDRQVHYYMSNGTPFTVCDSSWINHTYYDSNTGEQLLGQLALLNQLQSECKYRERRLLRRHVE